MKILLHGINFAPELTGIGKYTSEMAKWLADNGHEVRVVTAPPYYPQWKVGEDYSASRYQIEQFNGYKVWRCPLWIPNKVSGINRLIHLSSFALFSLPAMLRQIIWRPDVVWMAAPALACAPGAWLTARLSGAKAVIHIQDYEVDAAFDLGLLKSPLLKRITLGVERFILNRFDLVSTISNKMLGLAVKKGVKSESTVLFPNWVKICKENLDSEALKYRDQLGVPHNQIIVMYSGNMGEKQGLEILADVAGILSSSSHITFIFCGQGVGRGILENACQGLSNVLFLDLQPFERLPAFLALADIHLLPQKADAADLVMPSKLTGIFASGKPVIVTANADTELAYVVQEKGVVIPPNKPEIMAASILWLIQNGEIADQMGTNGRKYAEEHLDIDSVINRYIERITNLCKKNSNS